MKGAVLMALAATIGNFLQGWDNATIAGAIVYNKEDLELGATVEGLVVSMTLIGATAINTDLLVEGHCLLTESYKTGDFLIGFGMQTDKGISLSSKYAYGYFQWVEHPVRWSRQTTRKEAIGSKISKLNAKLGIVIVLLLILIARNASEKLASVHFLQLKAYWAKD